MTERIVGPVGATISVPSGFLPRANDLMPQVLQKIQEMTGLARSSVAR
jgi:hypothetical protein